MNGTLFGLLMVAQHRHPIFSISEREHVSRNRTGIEQLYLRLIPRGGLWPPYDRERDWLRRQPGAAQGVDQVLADLRGQRR